jgi:SAM-dependent methyltransferase
MRPRACQRQDREANFVILVSFHEVAARKHRTPTEALESPAVDGLLDATAQAEERHFWFHALRRNARACLDASLADHPPKLIVDCGTGTGRNLDWLATLGPAAGLELSPTGVRHARANGRRVVRGSVTHLPFADASVDVATSFDVFVCLDDRAEAQAAREMWRVLKPGGLALIHAAALDILYGAHSAFSGEHRRYTRRRLTALLSGVGFTIERVTYTNLATFPVLLVVRLFDRLTGRKVAGAAADLAVPPAPVNATFDAVLRAESALLRRVNLPIGSSVLCVARKPGHAR